MSERAQPASQRIAADLRQAIQSGELSPGALVPSERELIERYGTTKSTVGKVIAALRAEGLLTTQPGRGTFVRAEPPMKYFASLTGSRRKRLDADRRRDTFAQQIEAQGKVPKQVSTTEVIAADSEIAAHLALEPGEDVGVRRRVMYANEEPLQLGDSYYPLDIVNGSKIMNPTDVTEGTDQVLEDLGHIATRYEDEITWRMPTADESAKLHIGPGSPIGRLLRTSFDQNDMPIEVYVVILPADRHVLLYEVSAE